MSKLIRFLREVRHAAGDLWNRVEQHDYCCGVAQDRNQFEYMPTASSCCGVRV
jgi:hypothetical protein